MDFTPTPLGGNYLISVNAFSDNRGWFSRYFSKERFDSIGHKAEWVQMNHSFNIRKGTIRGLHFQAGPAKETKLVRCIAGALWDVVVDLRKDSPTYLQSFGQMLSAQNKIMMYVPEGFAHGFQTLTDDCELLYCHTAYYSKDFEGGLRYDDPVLGIQWPEPVSVISERDLSFVLIDSKFKGIE